ncbi:hypothetical protein ACLM5J_15810 [Nocardioides sp. Bht2]|uniref:hypothetical protein n=1 Tax=Nocardioides sp. Bht2 TaxID=3392297 RepID=UPI0039B4134C
MPPEQVVYRFRTATIPILAALTVTLIVASLLASRSWADGERALALVHGTIAVALALCVIATSRSGLLTATADRLAWQRFTRRSIAAAEITDLEVVTGQSGRSTYSWPLIHTSTKAIELRRFRVALDRSDELHAVLRQMKSVLALSAPQADETEAVTPPLRVARPTSVLLMTILVLASCLALTFLRPGPTEGHPLSTVLIVGFVALTAVLGRWLQGSAVVVDDATVRQVGGSEVCLATSAVTSFRVEPRPGVLTVAALVADTEAGAVIFHGMVATWGQTQHLERIAAQLNARLQPTLV